MNSHFCRVIATRAWHVMAVCIMGVTTMFACLSAASAKQSAATQPDEKIVVDYSKVLVGLDVGLADPSWQIRHLLLSQELIKMHFMDLEKEDLASMMAEILHAHGLVMNNRAKMTRANLTVYLLKDASFGEAFLKNAETNERKAHGKSFSGITVGDMTVKAFELFPDDHSHLIEYEMTAYQVKQQYRTIRVARGRVVLELNDQGLDLSVDAVAKAMRTAFDRCDAAHIARPPSSQPSSPAH